MFMRNPCFEKIIKISAELSKILLFPKCIHFQLLEPSKLVKHITWGYKKLWLNSSYHGLRTPREEKAFTARPKIHSHSQIFRYSQSIFCLPLRPNFSDIFDLCLHWVSVVRGSYHCAAQGSSSNSMKGLVNWEKTFQLCKNQRPLKQLGCHLDYQ